MVPPFVFSSLHDSNDHINATMAIIAMMATIMAIMATTQTTRAQQWWRRRRSWHKKTNKIYHNILAEKVGDNNS
jgi:hypothetical protein